MTTFTDQELDGTRTVPDDHPNLLCVIYVRTENQRKFKLSGCSTLNRANADRQVAGLIKQEQEQGETPRIYRVMNYDKFYDYPKTMAV